ncbi:hypothetical protein BpHYR1_044482 [Brachionus plicatilis]|uniref:Uncharacterized protein n=1 Tax=Brachionus plicatilis TaxID=10195 RepID=A0A3M7SZ77_BRAPC|nr:hypothetical protein BpHYR1_044482 [Brachionus plicatilis]
MSRHDLGQMNEKLKKLDFFNINDFVSFEETNLNNLKTSFESEESEKKPSNISENTEEKSSKRAIDIINEKISKLDDTFAQFSDIRATGRPESYQIIPDLKTTELLNKLKEKQDKEIKRFGGIYSMKNVIYEKKTTIPLSFSMKTEEQDSAKIPKLVELYQYTQYDSRNIISLPHDVAIEDVLHKVLESITILQREPHYRKFLCSLIFSKSCRFVIHDTFWWCFLQRYQKLPGIQFEYFNRISENYVKILFDLIESRYREKFFKSFADLLALSVYTIFCTCFPQSHMTHFNDEFKEFLCTTAHSWISGCMPSPKSFSHWNFKIIDPSAAVFAQEVLNNKQNNILEFNLETPSHHSVVNSKNQSRISQSNSSLDKKSSTSSMMKRKNAAETSFSSEAFSNKSSKMNKIIHSRSKKDSHPAGKGPEYENCLFDLYGKSPLVELYLYNFNAQKINNAETLIRHSRIIELPPLNAPTYRDLIDESVKNIRKIEKELKLVSARQKTEHMKFVKERRNSLRLYQENLEKVLGSQKEVSIIGELLTMNAKKDPNSTNFALDLAIKKAIVNTSKH